uniref:RING-type domain-containing protein n=1 Tax=viral metagenome TaxID=1070528 RepID=A0A6C0BQ07_9ZZZZ
MERKINVPPSWTNIVHHTFNQLAGEVGEDLFNETLNNVLCMAPQMLPQSPALHSVLDMMQSYTAPVSQPNEKKDSIAPPPIYEDEIEDIYEDEIAENDANTCCVCMVYQKNTVFQCGHLQTCQTCAKQLTQCPICRQTIQQCIRVYQ